MTFDEVFEALNVKLTWKFMAINGNFCFFLYLWREANETIEEQKVRSGKISFLNDGNWMRNTIIWIFFMQYFLDVAQWDESYCWYFDTNIQWFRFVFNVFTSWKLLNSIVWFLQSYEGINSNIGHRLLIIIIIIVNSNVVNKMVKTKVRCLLLTVIWCHPSIRQNKRIMTLPSNTLINGYFQYKIAP